MRLNITLESDRLSLPLHYGHIVQGFVYSQLEPNLASWLHGEAYTHAKRTFKMFTFSRLNGRSVLDSKTKRLIFTGPVSLKLASHSAEVLASFAEHLLKAGQLRLGQTPVTVSGVEILKPPAFDDTPAKVKTLSPITIYSTFTKPGGGKLTHYYAPHEKDWSPMLLGNLTRKAKALGWENPEQALEGSSIEGVNTQRRDKKVVRYKGFVMEAWAGVYELDMPQAYKELAYDVGLGGKNAQGMGCVEVC